MQNRPNLVFLSIMFFTFFSLQCRVDYLTRETFLFHNEQPPRILLVRSIYEFKWRPAKKCDIYVNVNVPVMATLVVQTILVTNERVNTFVSSEECFCVTSLVVGRHNIFGLLQQGD